jgi:hypothetical protein
VSGNGANFVEFDQVMYPVVQVLIAGLNGEDTANITQGGGVGLRSINPVKSLRRPRNFSAGRRSRESGDLDRALGLSR